MGWSRAGWEELLKKVFYHGVATTTWPENERWHPKLRPTKEARAEVFSESKLKKPNLKILETAPREGER